MNNSIVSVTVSMIVSGHGESQTLRRRAYDTFTSVTMFSRQTNEISVD